MGVFEFDAFARGTYGVAETLAELTPKVWKPPAVLLHPQITLICCLS
jgi:hypothetical protein